MAEKKTSWLDQQFGGKIFVYPLVPSLFAFILAIVSSFIVNFSDISVCSTELKVYVFGFIGISYGFTFFYGFTLVGPEFKELWILITIWGFLLAIALGWLIFGTVAVAQAAELCKEQALWKHSLALIIIFWALIGIALILALTFYLISVLHPNGVSQIPSGTAGPAAAGAGAATNNAAASSAAASSAAAAASSSSSAVSTSATVQLSEQKDQQVVASSAAASVSSSSAAAVSEPAAPVVSSSSSSSSAAAAEAASVPASSSASAAASSSEPAPAVPGSAAEVKPMTTADLNLPPPPSDLEI